MATTQDPRWPLAEALRVTRQLRDALAPSCERIAIAGSVRRIKPHGSLAYRLNSRGNRTYGPLNKLLVHLPTGIPVDVFITTAENWGMALVVRTGPKELNIWLFSRLRQLGMRGHAYGGVTGPNGGEIACPTEEAVFRRVGWPFVPPDKRAPPAEWSCSWPGVRP